MTAPVPVSPPPVYCIDSSSLIAAWSEHYPPTAFPGVWEKVDELIAAGRFCSPDEVSKEVSRKDDELKEWVKTHRGMFIPVDPVQAAEVKAILARYRRLTDTAKGRGGGDPWVIALAKVRGYTVVTQEALTGSTTRYKIPDVCVYYRVPYVRVVEMIVNEGWSFR
jgi:Domain of unknown function (DUF4411)